MVETFVRTIIGNCRAVRRDVYGNDYKTSWYISAGDVLVSTQILEARNL